MGIIKQQTIKGTIYSYLGAAIGFITLIIIQPHALTTEQYGLTGILLSLSMLFSQFATLGFSGTSRYFPYFRSEEKKHHGYLFLFCLIALLGTILIIILTCIFKEQIISEKAQKSSLFNDYFWYLIPLIFFTVFFNVFDLYARLLYNAASGTILREFTKRLFILLAILLIYFKLISFSTFMILWLIANIIPTFILTGILIRDNQFFFTPDFQFLDKDMKRKLRNISLFALLTSSSPVIVDTIDRYIINTKFGLSDAGVYTMAVYFSAIITLPARSLYNIATVVVSEAWKANDLKNIKSIYIKSCVNQLIVALFLLLIIWANVDSVFKFMPPKYYSGKYVILFIGIANVIDSATGINGVIFSTSKYFRFDAYFYVFLIGVAIVGNLWLIPLYGITGSAMAATLTVLVFNLFRCLFIQKVFKMQPFTMKSPFIIITGICIYFLSVFVVPQNNNPMLDIVLRSSFLTILYWISIYYFKFSEDINQVLNAYLLKLKIRS